MTEFYLELAYEGIDYRDDELIDTLMGSAPFVHWGMVDGEVRAHAIIEASEAAAAARRVVSAVREVVPDARVTRVVEDLVSVGDVADRVPHSRQHVLMLAKGERGPGTFPLPRGTVGRNQKIWDWAPVKEWFEATYGFELGEERPLTHEEVVDAERAIHRLQTATITARMELATQRGPEPATSAWHTSWASVGTESDAASSPAPAFV